MVARILHSYNEANSWSNPQFNPVLGEGEIGIESDTGLMKIGDGKSAWNDLDYYTGEGQRYFFASLGGAPRESLSGKHRGQLVYAYTGGHESRTDRAFMYLNKKVLTRNGEEVNEQKCELIPISYFADIREQHIDVQGGENE